MIYIKNSFFSNTPNQSQFKWGGGPNIKGFENHCMTGSLNIVAHHCVPTLAKFHSNITKGHPDEFSIM